MTALTIVIAVVAVVGAAFVVWCISQIDNDD